MNESIARTSEKALKVIRMERILIIRSSKLASSIRDQTANVPHREGYSKYFWIDICLTKIQMFLKRSSQHTFLMLMITLTRFNPRESSHRYLTIPLLCGPYI